MDSDQKRKWQREEIDAYRLEHRQIFYFNKADSNLFIPKVYGFGITMNWANPWSWVIVVGLAVALVYRALTRH